jgi:hypothetical protein
MGRQKIVEVACEQVTHPEAAGVMPVGGRAELARVQACAPGVGAAAIGAPDTAPDFYSEAYWMGLIPNGKAA